MLVQETIKQLLPFLIAVVAGGGLTALYGWLAGHGLVPQAVRRVLADPHRRDQLVQLVMVACKYANLTPEDRRTESLRIVSNWLKNEGIGLSESQLNLLVELVYHRGKVQQAPLQVPPPLDWTGTR